MKQINSSGSLHYLLTKIKLIWSSSVAVVQMTAQETFDQKQSSGKKGNKHKHKKQKGSIDGKIFILRRLRQSTWSSDVAVTDDKAYPF